MVHTTSAAERDLVKTYDLHANAYDVKSTDLDRFVETVQAFGEVSTKPWRGSWSGQRTVACDAGARRSGSSTGRPVECHTRDHHNRRGLEDRDAEGNEDLLRDQTICGSMPPRPDLPA